MSEVSAGDHVRLANRLVGRRRGQLGGAWSRPVGTRRPVLGRLAGAGDRARLAARRRRPRHGRARLRDGLRVVVAGARGARPVGLDNSSRQLATAARFQGEFEIPFPLVHGDAERPPFADASFDLAISEYGAAIWCDPYRWIPEAARILRAGGELIFLGTSYLAMLTMPDEDLPTTERLQRDHFGMHRFEWPDADEGVEFHIPHGSMIRCCATPASRSRIWWRFALPRTPSPRRTRSPPRSGLDGGRSRKRGRFETVLTPTLVVRRRCP